MKPRRRKRTKNNYFTKVHEEAIVKYALSLSRQEKSELYMSLIQPAFDEMVNKIIFTYKFNNLPNIDYLRDDCKIWLTTILDKYDPNKGSKAFSYFSIVGKNYLILYNNTNYKKKKITTDVLAADEDDKVIHELGRPDRKQDMKDFIDYFTEYIDKHMFRLFKKENDRKVCDAVNILFKRRENLEIFNKKALYIYIREITNVDTPVITKVTKVLKKKYHELYAEYDKTGYVRV